MGGPQRVRRVVRTESWTYDATGNLATHTNREGAVQTFAPYDNRNRPTSFGWTGDPQNTQGQSFEYDLTSKVTALHNTEADIVNTYDAANRHTSETETIKSYGLYATRSTVSQYDADGNRSRVIFPQGYQFLYGYTQRNQLDNIKLDPAIFGGYYNTPLVQYVYDASGNHTRRTVLSGAHAEYDIDELNRVRGQSDYFANGQMGRFDYAFDAMGRHRYEQRDWWTADGYQFNPRDELTGYQRDGDLNMDGTVSASFWNNTGLQYDANGNRTQVTGSGADSYAVNSLNQYTSDANTGAMGYDPKGNLTSAAGWTYSYDAQNRLTTMQGPGMTITLTYDPLNRVITRAVNGAVTQNVWEGWNLIEEHRPDWSIQRCYLQGANQNELVAAFDGGVYSNHWYWQDGRGNTSHITGDNAYLLERYTYDLSGAPTFYDEWDNERFGGSAYDTRFLFAGSQYLPETGLYDMRNRFYSPTLNRFLQTDPIGFAGDALNLYRYCGDDPVDRSDPMGLDGDEYFRTSPELTRLSVQATKTAAKAYAAEKDGIGWGVWGAHRIDGRGVDSFSANKAERKDGPEWAGPRRMTVGREYEKAPNVDTSVYDYWVFNGHIHGRKGDPKWSDKDIATARKGVVVTKANSSDLDKQGNVKPGHSIKRLSGVHNGNPVDERVYTAPQKAPSSSSNNNSSGPNAAEVDAANQGTGVGSLGAEAVNYVNGRL